MSQINVANYAVNSGSQPNAATFVKPTTPGNSIDVSVRFVGNVDPVLTDSLGNSLQPIGPPITTVGGARQAKFQGTIANGGAAHTITSSVSPAEIVARELNIPGVSQNPPGSVEALLQRLVTAARA